MLQTPLRSFYLRSLAAGVVLLAARGVAIADLPLESSVTQYGITWTFSNPVPVGQFVNGDYYVVGPATITSISPTPVYDYADGITRNGSVLDLTTNKGYTGFDSRLDSGRYSSTFDAHLPIPIKPGDALISSVSVTTPGQIPDMFRPSDYATNPIATQAILTCMNAQVPADTFRPSYLDRSHTQLYHASDLQWNLLPNLSLTGVNQISENYISCTPSNIATMFQRPWVDTIEFGFAAPMYNMPVYGREISRLAGVGSLLLESNYTQAQKTPLLINMTQVGIDLWGMVQNGYPGWEAFGGHNSGRKWLIQFAGTMLGDPAMAKPSQTFPNVNFQEDMQTAYGPCWTGADVVYTGHYGTAGTGIYGPYENLQPINWPGSLGENYRRCCTSSAWVGEALAAMILGVEGNWDQQAFFDYVDRWMTEDDTQAIQTILQQTGLDYSADFERQREVWDPFIQDMWNKYRATVAPQGGFAWAGNTNHNWSTALPDVNWSAGSAASWTNNAFRTTPNAATFAGATPATVTVNSNIDVRGINFTTGGWTLNPGTGVLAYGATGIMNITTTTGTDTINAVITNGSAFGTGGGVTSLAKAGPGTLILSAANTYSGVTTLNAGILLVRNTSGSATGTGNVTLNGGILGGSGTISARILPGSGPHTIHPGETLTPGNTATLKVGGLTTSTNTTLDFNLITPATVANVAASSSDRIQINGANNLTLNGGTIQFTTHPTGAGSLGYYKIMSYTGSIQGTGLASLILPPEANGVVYALSTIGTDLLVHRGFLGDADDSGTVDFADFARLSNNFGLSNLGWSGGDFNNDGITNAADFTLLSANFGATLAEPDIAAAASGVPEPATLLLLGAAMLTLLATRRPKTFLPRSSP